MVHLIINSAVDVRFSTYYRHVRFVFVRSVLDFVLGPTEWMYSTYNAIRQSPELRSACLKRQLGLDPRSGLWDLPDR